MRLSFAVVVALVSLLLSRAGARADDEEKAPSVYLYTIGASPDFPSRFGHAILCVRQPNMDTDGAGRCYDYGVPDSDDMIHIGWTAMRDVPGFVPLMVNEANVVQFFKNQGRAIERQRIPLTAVETHEAHDVDRARDLREAGVRVSPVLGELHDEAPRSPRRSDRRALEAGSVDDPARHPPRAVRGRPQRPDGHAHRDGDLPRRRQRHRSDAVAGDAVSLRSSRRRRRALQRAAREDLRAHGSRPPHEPRDRTTRAVLWQRLRSS